MEFFDKFSKGLVIHHWDTDGICSAGMLLTDLDRKKVDNLTPHIGNFYLTDKELDRINNRNYEFIAILDMAIPKHVILKLRNTRIFIFDHHLQPTIDEVDYIRHINPVSRGENPDNYPSATWVLSQWLGVDLLTILGAVGDREETLLGNKIIYGKIEKYLKTNSLTFQDLLRMVELIDSSYKIMDKKGVEEAVPYLIKTRDKPGKILNHKTWNQNTEKIRKEINHLLSSEVTRKNNSLILDINTRYNIISTLTRRLSGTNPGKTVMVINRGFFRDRDQLYIRGRNVHGIIEAARRKGYSAGGKKDVTGLILPKEDTDEFIQALKLTDLITYSK